MAILRGGRRIGNFDIRVGIPRDRSLQNVLGDPRLKQRAGGNPESTIGRFLGKVAEGEGFARPNRFLVDFILPRGINETSIGTAPGQNDQFVFEEEISRSTRPGELQMESELRVAKAVTDSQISTNLPRVWYGFCTWWRNFRRFKEYFNI